MAGGRPSLYRDEILISSREYVEGGYAKDDQVIPTIAGLAVHLGIARETIYDWARQENKAEFSDIVEGLMSLQEIKLLNKGLKGEFNPNIAKLALTKHGYVDKQDISANVKTDEPTEEQVDAAIERKLREYQVITD